MRSALALDPDDVAARADLADLLLDAGRAAEVRELLAGETRADLLDPAPGAGRARARRPGVRDARRAPRGARGGRAAARRSVHAREEARLALARGDSELRARARAGELRGAARAGRRARSCSKPRAPRVTRRRPSRCASGSRRRPSRTRASRRAPSGRGKAVRRALLLVRTRLAPREPTRRRAQGERRVSRSSRPTAPSCAAAATWRFATWTWRSASTATATARSPGASCARGGPRVEAYVLARGSRSRPTARRCARARRRASRSTAQRRRLRGGRARRGLRRRRRRGCASSTGSSSSRTPCTAGSCAWRHRTESARRCSRPTRACRSSRSTARAGSRASPAFVREGVHHIASGADHVAFLLALLLPAVLVGGAVWRPAPAFRPVLREVLLVVSAFTVGALADALARGARLRAGAVAAGRVGDRALGAGVRAVEPGPAAPRVGPALAFGFGLVHGMGFASALADLGSDRERARRDLARLQRGRRARPARARRRVLAGGLRAARLGALPARLRGRRLGSRVAGLGSIWLAERVLGRVFLGF